MFGRGVQTRDETRIAILAALGYDTSSDRALIEQLEQHHRERSGSLFPPVEVIRAGSRNAGFLRVRLPGNLALEGADFILRLRRDGGEETVTEGRMSPGRRATRRLRIPEPLEPGYHTIDLSVGAGGGELSASQRRIVHPGTCITVEEVLGGERTLGVWTNLYTVRSRRNQGVGDLTDLATLLDWMRDRGAEFVGINPLHAMRNSGGHASPYSPTSRLFRNEIYIDVRAVPELSHCSAAQQLLGSPEYSKACESLRGASHLDYERIASLKLKALLPMYDAMVAARTRVTERRQGAFEDFKRAFGRDLDRYATFKVLEESFCRQGLPASWHGWPRPYLDPDSSTVGEFRAANARAIDFHRYVQFELDRQLGGVAARARSDMAIGIYGDLALGSDPTGADAWANQDLIVQDARIGAPPDDFAAEGQDWGLPPLSPERLRATGYDYWIRLLQSNLRHMGALRLDHAMGLFRQFWIPRGLPGSEGAYVTYPARDLLGILALESRRNGTIIVGEDLGTVPPGFQSLLARWGILSSRVLYFERSRSGAFRASSSYSKRAIVTANTHDQVPLAGYQCGRDLDLRVGAGAYADVEQFRQAQRERARDRAGLLKRLTLEGFLPDEQAACNDAQFTRAVYSFLATTPAPLLGVSLDDLARESEPVNLPGVPQENFSSWSRKMGVTLEELTHDAETAATMDSLAAARRGRSAS